MAKHLFFLFFLLVSFFGLKAQELKIPDHLKIVDMDFHLYTDSLKKGVYNYINVDAQLSDSSYWPLDTFYLHFSSSAGIWHGNNLELSNDFTADSVVVTAQLKSKPELTKRIIIYAKKLPNPDRLPTEKEVLEEISKERNGR